MRGVPFEIPIDFDGIELWAIGHFVQGRPAPIASGSASPGFDDPGEPHRIADDLRVVLRGDKGEETDDLLGFLPPVITNYIEDCVIGEMIETGAVK